MTSKFIHRIIENQNIHMVNIWWNKQPYMVQKQMLNSIGKTIPEVSVEIKHQMFNKYTD